MTSDNDLDEPLLRIVCAAIRNRAYGIIICGVRHKDDLMRVCAKEIAHLSVLGPQYHNAEEGFVTNKQEFVTREQAWIIVERAGQIRPHPSTIQGCLHSEDLY